MSFKSLSPRGKRHNINFKVNVELHIAHTNIQTPKAKEENFYIEKSPIQILEQKVYFFKQKKSRYSIHKKKAAFE